MSRAAAVVLLVATVALVIDWRLLSLLFIDRESVARALATEADSPGPEYPRLIAAVHQRTQRGEAIAIIGPYRKWESGYDYPFYRASYLLPDRRVLPTLKANGDFDATILRNADYVLFWRVGHPPGADVIWREGDSALVRLQR